jgi:hypothetical protein
VLPAQSEGGNKFGLSGRGAAPEEGIPARSL